MKSLPITKLITERRVLVLLILVALGITLQGYLASVGKDITRYNNFVIFKNSFGHLLHHQNLYVYYPGEYFDLYKYSPAFATWMGVFYYLPDLLGLLLFNFINTALFILALRKLKLPVTNLRYVFLYLLVEFAISLIWTQTNIIICNLIILAFCYLEERKILLAALLISITVYIKIFGVVAFVIGLLYPDRFKFIVYSILWCVVFAILPIVIISPAELLQQYQNWWAVLKMDHSASYGVSFIGWIHSWFHLEMSKVVTVIIGAVVFCLPLIKFSSYKNHFFRLQMLASLLIWLVIFNHKGESPTYIIAMAGVAIWYFSQHPTTVNKVLLIFCLVFTSFSSTDLITPGWINDAYVEPYSIKAVFCCIIWGKLVFDLLFNKAVPKTSLNECNRY